MYPKSIGGCNENIQVYLVAIAHITKGEDFVSLSNIAKQLSISSATVNEMCGKMQAYKLVE